MTDAFGSSSDLDGIDLTDNTVSEGLPLLKTGIYDATSQKGIEIKKSKTGKMLAVVFQDDAGSGQITFNFNVINSSAEAQRIGRDQLKTFLTHGGHGNPDQPFKQPITNMEGLKVRIYVEHDGTYVKNNQTRDSYAIKRFAKQDKANPAPGKTAELARSGGATRSSGGGTSVHSPLDDEIPFEMSWK